MFHVVYPVKIWSKSEGKIIILWQLFWTEVLFFTYRQFLNGLSSVHCAVKPGRAVVRVERSRPVHFYTRALNNNKNRPAPSQVNQTSNFRIVSWKRDTNILFDENFVFEEGQRKKEVYQNVWYSVTDTVSWKQFKS